MYLALAEERGVDAAAARGHDAERHRQGVPRAGHLHLRARAVAPAHRRPRSATRCATSRSGTRSTCARTTCRRRARRRCEEVAYALATAIGVLDAVRDSGQVSDDEFPEVVGRISFFVNAGIRFVEEMCKLRAFGELWDRIMRRALRRHRREAAAVPLRRAGELARAHRGAAREQRAAHRARDARRHALAATPGPGPCSSRAWNEALGLPAAVGPAVVAADPAGAGVRDRPARVRRPLRGLARGRGEDRRAGRGRRGRARSGCSTAAAPSR